MLSAEVGYRVTRDPGVYTLYVLPCRRESQILPEKCAIVIGTLSDSALLRTYIREDEVPENGYCLRVMKNTSDAAYNWILIAGYDDRALFYGTDVPLSKVLMMITLQKSNNLSLLGLRRNMLILT